MILALSRQFPEVEFKLTYSIEGNGSGISRIKDGIFLEEVYYDYYKDPEAKKIRMELGVDYDCDDDDGELEDDK